MRFPSSDQAEVFDDSSEVLVKVRPEKKNKSLSG
jgi:hypothetical protein